MPLRIHPLNRVVLSAVAIMMLFISVVLIFPVQSVLIVLNGVFAGCGVALGVAYWRLLWNAMLGIRPYNRVRQMTLGFACCWLAYAIGVVLSIYLQSAGVDSRLAYGVALSRLIAIIAAVLQVTAPDFGLGLFHGRERKTLWTAIVLGAIAAIAATALQGSESLAEQSPLPGQTASADTLGAGM